MSTAWRISHMAIRRTIDKLLNTSSESGAKRPSRSAAASAGERSDVDSAAPATTVGIEGAVPSTAAKRAPRKAPAKSPRAGATRGAEAERVAMAISADARRAMIAEAAYLRAEKRGFAPGQEDADWLAAEAEVDRLLSERIGANAQ